MIEVFNFILERKQINQIKNKQQLQCDLNQYIGRKSEPMIRESR
jgi:hypothetical protein